MFVETKFNGATMPYGQRLAIERLCDACNTPPTRYSVAFITSHRSEGDIDFANTVVTEYRWQGKWIKPTQNDKTLYEGIVRFREITLPANVVPFKKSA